MTHPRTGGTVALGIAFAALMLPMARPGAAESYPSQSADEIVARLNAAIDDIIGNRRSAAA